MKKIVLDTNAYVELLNGNEHVLNALGKAENVYLPVIAIGELLTGFKGGSREAENRKLLERFLQKSTVQILDLTMETAEVFSEIQSNLKKTGNPLPVNDVWIAAGAVETGSVVVTFDSHFQKIPAVRVWNMDFLS